MMRFLEYDASASHVTRCYQRISIGKCMNSNKVHTHIRKNNNFGSNKLTLDSVGHLQSIAGSHTRAHDGGQETEPQISHVDRVPAPIASCDLTTKSTTVCSQTKPTNAAICVRKRAHDHHSLHTTIYGHKRAQRRSKLWPQEPTNTTICDLKRSPQTQQFAAANEAHEHSNSWSHTKPTSAAICRRKQGPRTQ